MLCKNEDGTPRFLVKKFLCCLSLRTGTLTVAFIEIMLLLAFLIAQIYSLAIPDVYLVPVVLCTTLTHLAASCILIHGVRMHEREMVWGWMWMRAILLLTDFSSMVVQAAVFLYIEGVIYFIASVITIYNMIVIRSYAYSMTKIKGTARLREIPDNVAGSA